MDGNSVSKKLSVSVAELPNFQRVEVGKSNSRMCAVSCHWHKIIIRESVVKDKTQK